MSYSVELSMKKVLYPRGQDSLSLLVHIKSSVLIFFAEKIDGRFKLQKHPAVFFFFFFFL